MDEYQDTLTAQSNSLLERCWNAISRALHGDAQGWSDFLVLTLEPALKALAIMFASYLIGKLLSRLIAQPISNRIDKTLGKFIANLLFRGTVVCGFVYVLSSFGIKSTSFAALIAAMGFAIGLAFQGTLGNFAAGILLMVFRPFKVGDMVVAGNVTGKVTEIDLFTTAIDTFDNRRLIVPNNQIAGHTIENVTYHAKRRIDITLLMPWSTDIERTRGALLQSIDVMREHLADDSDHISAAWVVALNGATIEWQLQFWAKTSEFRAVREKAIMAIKASLDEASLSPAIPRYKLLMEESDELTPTRTVPRRILGSKQSVA